MTPMTAHSVRTAIAPAGAERILDAQAVGFVADLVRMFRPRVAALLEARKVRARHFDSGGFPSFDPATADVRSGDWSVAKLPPDLLDRRVEITGPVDRKMVINALNSGANVFMADFEDATAPTWANQIEGQQNLYDAVRRTIAFEDPSSKKKYALSDATAVLLVRPRGWHLPEAHFLVDGEVAPGSLVDFGLYFFHNAKEALARGTGPYFYLPKLEHFTEARLWNDVFVAAQDKLGVPQGSIKATVLIETLPAAFQMDEILFELRAHMAGLNCGRWDYIFSSIKTLREHKGFVLPDRASVTMEQPMMRAYTQLLVKTCHRRGAFAMGGMAAQIPIKNDPDANEQALAKVRADKLREVKDGHDGTWVAHPALVPIARAVFDAHMTEANSSGSAGEPLRNQLSVSRDDVQVSEQDLLSPPEGPRTIAGLRQNVRVGVQYIAAWLCGNGCVPLYNLMEDAATAEISRSQVWQWLHHGALVDGTPLTRERFAEVLAEEMRALEEALGGERFLAGKHPEAARLFETISTRDTLADFLTLEAYPSLVVPFAT